MSQNEAQNNRNQHRPFWEKACVDFMQRLIACALKLANGRSYDAEDLVQGTVCRALSYAKDPQEVKSPLGYLLSIMRSIWINEWRKAHTADTESLDELLSAKPDDRLHRQVEPAVEPEAERFLENEEYRAELKANMGRLTPREKQLLRLYLEGYNCKEIAAKLNEDVRLIRSDLNAVRTKVRLRLMKGKR